MFAGLLTSASVSVLGVVLAVAGCVAGSEKCFLTSTRSRADRVRRYRITTERRVVERVPVAPISCRMLPWKPTDMRWLKGGLAGGVAMAVLACTYGLLKAGSIWYPSTSLLLLSTRNPLSLETPN